MLDAHVLMLKSGGGEPWDNADVHFNLDQSYWVRKGGRNWSLLLLGGYADSIGSLLPCEAVV